VIAKPAKTSNDPIELLRDLARAHYNSSKLSNIDQTAICFIRYNISMDRIIPRFSSGTARQKKAEGRSGLLKIP